MMLIDLLLNERDISASHIDRGIVGFVVRCRFPILARYHGAERTGVAEVRTLILTNTDRPTSAKFLILRNIGGIRSASSSAHYYKNGLKP